MFKGQEMLLSLAVMNILFCSKYLVLVQPGWWSVVAILNWIIGLSGNRVPQTIVVYHHSKTQMVMVGYVYVYVYIYIIYYIYSLMSPCIETYEIPGVDCRRHYDQPYLLWTDRKPSDLMENSAIFIESVQIHSGAELVVWSVHRRRPSSGVVLSNQLVDGEFNSGPGRLLVIFPAFSHWKTIK